jgi:hypothetical protein
MIILDEKYAIDADTNCWQLCRKEKYKEKETGEEKERYAPFKYYGTIQKTVEHYIDIRQKEKISSKEYKSLNRALTDLKKLQKELEQKIDL